MRLGTFIKDGPTKFAIRGGKLNFLKLFICGPNYY